MQYLFYNASSYNYFPPIINTYSILFFNTSSIYFNAIFKDLKINIFLFYISYEVITIFNLFFNGLKFIDSNVNLPIITTFYFYLLFVNVVIY